MVNAHLSLSKELGKIGKRLQELQERRSALEANRDRLERSVELGENLLALYSRKDELAAESGAINEKIEGLKERIRERNARLRKLAKELREFPEEMDYSLEKVPAKKKEFKKLGSEVPGYIGQARELRQRESELRKELKALKAEIQSAEREFLALNPGAGQLASAAVRSLVRAFKEDNSLSPEACTLEIAGLRREIEEKRRALHALEEDARRLGLDLTPWENWRKGIRRMAERCKSENWPKKLEELEKRFISLDKRFGPSFSSECSTLNALKKDRERFTDAATIWLSFSSDHSLPVLSSLSEKIAGKADEATAAALREFQARLAPLKSRLADALHLLRNFKTDGMEGAAYEETLKLTADICDACEKVMQKLDGLKEFQETRIFLDYQKENTCLASNHLRACKLALELGIAAAPENERRDKAWAEFDRLWEKIKYSRKLLEGLPALVESFEEGCRKLGTASNADAALARLGEARASLLQAETSIPELLSKTAGRMGELEEVISVDLMAQHSKTLSDINSLQEEADKKCKELLVQKKGDWSSCGFLLKGAHPEIVGRMRPGVAQLKKAVDFRLGERHRTKYLH